MLVPFLLFRGYSESYQKRLLQKPGVSDLANKNFSIHGPLNHLRSKTYENRINEPGGGESGRGQGIGGRGQWIKR